MRFLCSTSWRLAIILLFAGETEAQSIESWISEKCAECADRMDASTGAYILEKGEEALIGRAWLARHAEKTIDVQYFIWSTDNIGTLAAEQLLLAAERGVMVRVLVDDFLIDAQDQTLLLLSAHPNVEIRIYNPNVSVGTSFLSRLFNVVTQFRSLNQRMHDKTAIFDGVAGITGGRNMADEYFDFDHDYNFRDRDILLLGLAVRDMQKNFEEFWNSELAQPVEQVLNASANTISATEASLYTAQLHAYANDPANFEPAIRNAITNISGTIPVLLDDMSWQEVSFISDTPGKNDGTNWLGGGGESTFRLADALRNARYSILIQSPYLVLPKGGIEMFEELSARGVSIRISTNSLASTDNIPAFSGYHRQRPRLLQAGIELFEYKPRPGVQSELVARYAELAHKDPIFAVHAKSMVIDGKRIFIGTFNLDPRSANLNTEVGVFIESEKLAQQLTHSIERDMLPENSWQTTAEFAPDYEVSRSKRLQLGFVNLLPIEPLL
jgi:putative cardiolipin synthase